MVVKVIGNKNGPNSTTAGMPFEQGERRVASDIRGLSHGNGFIRPFRTKPVGIVKDGD
jgi:hypothetical protein